LQATRDGHIATLLEAGATIGTPGCGPCMGNHMGVPAPNDVAITTMNRNFRGRMGTRDAEIYLANPYIVAMSALAGEIVAADEAIAIGD
ncbi:MAG: aconitase family protein, partial [Chloroflexota bacterium]